MNEEEIRVLMESVSQDPVPICLRWARNHPARVLLALLTDECDFRNRHGVHPPSPFETCPACGGRGWLPKDGVSEGWQWTTEGKREPSGDLIIPLDCLDAEDE